jgi:hypothetical protein
VCGRSLARLLARRHPRAQHQLHRHLEGPTLHADSSYAGRRFLRVPGS